MSDHLPRPASSGFALSDASRPSAAPFVFIAIPVKFSGLVPVHLRLIDPPDMAAYAPAGGWPAKGAPAVPPYEANDNDVWADPSNTDWGLSATYPGTLNRNLEIDVYPGSSRLATFYLKLPARYAGDNWQIEVRKKSPSGTLIPNEVASYSPVFTGWKRVFVERDHMFRRGGLLYANAAVNDTSVTIYKNPDDTRWDNLNSGDRIALFDTQTIYEGPHDEAYVGTITEVGSSAPHQMLVTLVTTRGGSTAYHLVRAYACSPVEASTYLPNFSQGASAGIGVVNSTTAIGGEIIDDIDANQMNLAGAAFYMPDTRDFKQPFDDAFTQFIFPRSGMGAVPYMSKAWFDWISTAGVPGMNDGNAFSRAWFANKSISGGNYVPNNYFHLISASDCTGAAGIAWYPDNWSFVFQGQIENNLSLLMDQIAASQAVAEHELGHQFNLNPTVCSGHDSNNAWCDGDGHCNSGLSLTIHCLMNIDGTQQEYYQQMTDGINRFDTQDLLLHSEGTANSITCPQNVVHSWNAGDGSIRGDTDPQ